MKPQPIWHPQPHPFISIRGFVRFSGPRRQGWLRCACSGPFQLFLDGRPIGSGPGGELTHVPAWERFDIDVEAAGEQSVLVVRAAAGRSPGWFVCEGEVSGSPVGTDGSWTGLAVTSVGGESMMSEHYSALDDPALDDLARVDSGLGEAASAAAWEPCVAVDAAPEPARLPTVPITHDEVEAHELVASGEIDALRLPVAATPAPLIRCKCVHPDGLLQGQQQRTTIRTPDVETGACVVLDFGRQIFGAPFLSLQTEAAGGIVDLFFLTRAADRVDDGVRYVCRAGRQRWTGLRSHSCRYVLVRFSGFAAHDCQVEQLGIRVRRVDGPSAESVGDGGTVSGDEQLEALWAVGSHGNDAWRQQVYRLDTYPAPYDWLWALPHFLNDCCRHGDTTTARAMLSSTGVPEGELDLRRWLGYPLFVEAYLQHSGDRTTVSEALGSVTSLLYKARELRRPSGLLPATDEWSDTRVTVLAAGAARAAARLYDAFAMRAEKELADDSFESLTASVLPRWSPQAHLFSESGDESDYTQLTNVLVLLFGLVDETKQQEILAAVRGAGIVRARGLAEAFFVTAGFWEARAQRRAMQCLQTYWGRLCDRDGPTWLDKQGGTAGVGGAPGPEYFLASRVAGVRPATPGYETIEIELPSMGVERLGAQLPTANGWVRVEWWHPESQHSYRVEVQTESDAKVRLCMPRPRVRFPEITINDETVWRNDKAVPNPWVHEIADEPERIVLSVAGTRSITAQLS